jgi:hypothetical protein
MVRNLGLLADAAPPGRAGALHRLWQVAESNRDELDELEWDAEEDEDGFDELPA